MIFCFIQKYKNVVMGYIEEIPKFIANNQTTTIIPTEACCTLIKQLITGSFDIEKCILPKYRIWMC